MAHSIFALNILIILSRLLSAHRWMRVGDMAAEIQHCMDYMTRGRSIAIAGSLILHHSNGYILDNDMAEQAFLIIHVARLDSPGGSR